MNVAKSLSAVAFAPDGNQVVTGDRDGVLRIVLNSQVIRELSGHTGQIEDITFNHAGTFMASASKDYSVRLWNFRNLKEQPIALSDHDWVWSVTFTPDDSQLLAGINSIRETVKGIDQTIHAYPTNFEVMADILCDKTKRNMTKEEWDLYVGDDLTYETTCPNYPENYK